MSSVFTGNPMGGKPGDSNWVKTSKMPGGTINVGYTQDNVHGLDLPNCMGKELGGSESSLSHSLSGTSAVQRMTRNRG